MKTKPNRVVVLLTLSPKRNDSDQRGISHGAAQWEGTGRICGAGALSNGFGILLRDYNADPSCEVQAE
jgi:hypothetical protein